MAGAHPCRAQLHQPVFAVLGVQPEREPDGGGSRHHTEADAEPLARACHVQDDKEDEGGKQPACEDEQVFFSPLNSTGRPMPLLIGYSAIVLIPYYICIGLPVY